jgi:RHS repeat-associated protein
MGTLVASQNFDAWGRGRNPNDWTYNNVPVQPDWLYRGYTGHEHLAQFALINMNGRMYDPITGRMLSPDNYISVDENTQGYNRYGYALNNPLRITDPSGEFLHIIIGAVVGGVINLAVHAIHGQIHNVWDGLKAFGVGAVAGGLGAATGGAALAASGLTGASVAGGALAGFTGSVVSSPVLGIGNNYFFGDPYRPQDLARDMLIGAVGGAVVGGTLGYLKGNNIWTGERIAQGRTPFSLDNTPTGEDPTYDPTPPTRTRNRRPIPIPITRTRQRTVGRPIVPLGWGKRQGRSQGDQMEQLWKSGGLILRMMHLPGKIGECREMQGIYGTG